MDTSSIFGFIVALYASLTTCAVPPSDLPAQQQEQTAIVAEQETQEPAEPEVQPIYDPVTTPKQPTVNAANVGYNDKNPGGSAEMLTICRLLHRMKLPLGIMMLITWEIPSTKLFI